MQYSTRILKQIINTVVVGKSWNMCASTREARQMCEIDYLAWGLSSNQSNKWAPPNFVSNLPMCHLAGTQLEVVVSEPQIFLGTRK